MCVMSMVIDYGKQTWPGIYPTPNTNPWYPGVGGGGTVKQSKHFLTMKSCQCWKCRHPLLRRLYYWNYRHIGFYVRWFRCRRTGGHYIPSPDVSWKQWCLKCWP